MKFVRSMIERTLLQKVSQDNFFHWKKAAMLAETNVIFLLIMALIVTPVHFLDFKAHPTLGIGDAMVVVFLIISILLLKNGKVFTSGMCTLVAFLMVPLMHNLIGDWINPVNIRDSRFFETLILICLLFIMINTYATSRWQIVTVTVLSVSIVLAHYFVLTIVAGMNIPYFNLLYLLLPIALGINASILLRQVDDAINSLVKSKQQMEMWNKSLEETVAQRTKELVEINNKLDELSRTDGLTGLGNRRQFDQGLLADWNQALRSASKLALIIGDVDWFKNYNDIYGHHAGDDCLRTIAQVFSDSARRESDLVARYGGEEFAVIFPVLSSDQAVSFAQSLIQKLRELNLPHSGSKFGVVTISLGIAVFTPQADQAAEDILKAADAALYTAKARGRNQYVLWGEEQQPCQS